MGLHGQMAAPNDPTTPDRARTAARAALRWVTDAAVTADGGMTWPQTRAPGAPLTDDLYAGTAGILAALAEARLADLTEFDDHARAAAGRLRALPLPAGVTSQDGATSPDGATSQDGTSPARGPPPALSHCTCSVG
jgi:hypothetical protein